VDLSPRGITGRDAALALEEAGLILNKNVIPFDTQSPTVTSGVRIGTPAVTTRGMKEQDMSAIGDWIVKVLDNIGDTSVRQSVRTSVEDLASRFPVP